MNSRLFNDGFTDSFPWRERTLPVIETIPASAMHRPGFAVICLCDYTQYFLHAQSIIRISCFCLFQNSSFFTSDQLGIKVLQILRLS